jgi:hypothetical protein
LIFFNLNKFLKKFQKQILLVLKLIFQNKIIIQQRDAEPHAWQIFALQRKIFFQGFLA